MSGWWPPARSPAVEGDAAGHGHNLQRRLHPHPAVTPAPREPVRRGGRAWGPAGGRDAGPAKDRRRQAQPAKGQGPAGSQVASPPSPFESCHRGGPRHGVAARRRSLPSHTGGGATGGARSRGGVARGGRRMARQVTREGGGCHVAAWRVGPAWTVTPSLAATCTSPSPRRHEAPTRRRAGPVQGLGSRRPTTHTHRRLGFATRKAADRPREAPGLRGPRIPPSQSLRVSPSEPDPPSQSQGRDCSGRRRGGAMRPCRSPECPRRLGPRARVEARAGARPGRSSRLRLSPAGVAGMQPGEGGPGGLAEGGRGGRDARVGGRVERRAGSRRGNARGASGATSQSRA